MGCIYIVRNTVNDKVYIGQTVSPLSKRWAAHLYAARTYGTTKLYINMRSLGIDNFFVEKLVDEDSWEELNRLEIEYIQLFDSINNGYNTMLGGTSLKNMLYKHTEDIIFDYICGSSSMEISKQYNCSDETILNLLKSNGIHTDRVRKEVVAVDFDKVFKSSYEAARYIIKSRNTKSSNVANVAKCIVNACRCMTEAYGVKFAYLEDIQSGEYEYGKYLEENINISPKELKCSVCNKPITIKSKTGMCNSCANVVARGKTSKPSREKLIQESKVMTKSQLAKKYDRSISTICAWFKSYGI